MGVAGIYRCHISEDARQLPVGPSTDGHITAGHIELDEAPDSLSAQYLPAGAVKRPESKHIVDLLKIRVGHRRKVAETPWVGQHTLCHELVKSRPGNENTWRGPRINSRALDRVQQL